MKKNFIFTTILTLVFAMFTSQTINISAKEEMSYLNNTEEVEVNVISNEKRIVITMEETTAGTHYREYHDSVLIDELVISKETEVPHDLNNTKISPRSNPNMSATNLGSIYYNVTNYSNQIKIDLRYRNNGAPQQTTYELKNRYVSSLAAAIDIAGALFIPQKMAVTIFAKLLTWVVFKAVGGALEKQSKSSLSASAQNQFVYAYAARQAPDQAELSRTFTGTIYTINHNNKYLGEKFSDGYTSHLWKDTGMGVGIGNQFFFNYFSIAKWI